MLGSLIFIIVFGWVLAYYNPKAIGAIFNIAIVVLLFAVIIAIGSNK